MRRAHLFNPENDLALASGMKHFTPPRAALAMQRAGECLPLFWADKEDVVLCRDVDYAMDLKSRYNLAGTPVSYVEGEYEAAPWGWSLHAVKQFEELSDGRLILPDTDFLERVKKLSHRGMSRKVFEALQSRLPYKLPEAPVMTSSIEEVEELLGLWKHIFVKSPLSGSGRGVIDSGSTPVAQLLRLARGVIRHQGAVMVERGLDNRCDFALLYDMDEDGAHYRALSLFFKGSHVAYGGNILASQEQLYNRVADQVGRNELDETRDAVSEVLSSLYNGYKGAIGVDMIVYSDENEELRIDPCIEVNVRMTMGRVAAHVYEHCLKPDRQGRMIIEFGKYTEGEILTDKRLNPSWVIRT